MTQSAKVAICLTGSLLFLGVAAAEAQNNIQAGPSPVTGAIYHTGGNVGIGTPAPQRSLDVYSADANEAVRIQNSIETSYTQLAFKGTGRQWQMGVGNGGETFLGLANKFFVYDALGGVRLAIDTAGNVGMGTSTPQRSLDIYSADANEAVRIQNSIATSYTQLAFKGTGRQWQMGVGNGGETFLGLANKFFVYDALGGVRLAIDTAGNVGMGTSTPTAKLHVAGNIIASGSITGATVINATYQDFAEWVPATEAVSAGTVVVLNRARSNEVMPSTMAYDTTVAGVVSAQPGILLGVDAPSKAKIATMGRVCVKVGAGTNGIAVGDLLVTSDKPGTAMRSEPIDVAGVKLHRPGTIIGKALEPLAGGEGEILVLLSLQ